MTVRNEESQTLTLTACQSDDWNERIECAPARTPKISINSLSRVFARDCPVLYTLAIDNDHPHTTHKTAQWLYDIQIYFNSLLLLLRFCKILKFQSVIWPKHATPTSSAFVCGEGALRQWLEHSNFSSKIRTNAYEMAQLKMSERRNNWKNEIWTKCSYSAATVHAHAHAAVWNCICDWQMVHDSVRTPHMGSSLYCSFVIVIVVVVRRRRRHRKHSFALENVNDKQQIDFFLFWN